METELATDVMPLRLGLDGNVIIPMTFFPSIKKGDYDDAWASNAVRCLPAFTPDARDPDTGQVDLNHASSRNTPSNRKKYLGQCVRIFFARRAMVTFGMPMTITSETCTQMRELFQTRETTHSNWMDLCQCRCVICWMYFSKIRDQE